MTAATPSNSSADTHPLIREHRIVVVPGVYDVLSAKVAERVGFESVVLTGYGFAASYLGEPDFGLFTQSEILDAARRVTAAVRIGLVVDGDTGHGGPLNVQRMVRELVRMGARGIILEDQQWPKRCGHMRGKAVIGAEEHAAKLRAARSGPAGWLRRSEVICSPLRLLRCRVVPALDAACRQTTLGIWLDGRTGNLPSSGLSPDKYSS